MQHEVFRSEEQQLRLYAPVFARLPDGEVEARTLIVTDTTVYLCKEAFGITDPWSKTLLFHQRARFSMPYQLPLASLSRVRVVVTEGSFSTGEHTLQESILLGFGQRKLFEANVRSHTCTHTNTHVHTRTHTCMYKRAQRHTHKLALVLGLGTLPSGSCSAWPAPRAVPRLCCVSLPLTPLCRFKAENKCLIKCTDCLILDRSLFGEGGEGEGEGVSLRALSFLKITE